MQLCFDTNMLILFACLKSLACAGNFHKLPRFSNLTRIEVYMDSADFVNGSLIAILQKSPNLESIKLVEVTF